MQCLLSNPELVKYSSRILDLLVLLSLMIINKNLYKFTILLFKVTNHMTPIASYWCSYIKINISDHFNFLLNVQNINIVSNVTTV